MARAYLLEQCFHPTEAATSSPLWTWLVPSLTRNVSSKTPRLPTSCYVDAIDRLGIARCQMGAGISG